MVNTSISGHILLFVRGPSSTTILIFDDLPCKFIIFLIVRLEKIYKKGKILLLDKFWTFLMQIPFR